jgi:hypothetical protein
VDAETKDIKRARDLMQAARQTKCMEKNPKKKRKEEKKEKERGKEREERKRKGK